MVAGQPQAAEPAQRLASLLGSCHQTLEALVLRLICTRYNVVEDQFHQGLGAEMLALQPEKAKGLRSARGLRLRSSRHRLGRCSTAPAHTSSRRSPRLSESSSASSVCGRGQGGEHGQLTEVAHTRGQVAINALEGACYFQHSPSVWHWPDSRGAVWTPRRPGTTELWRYVPEAGPQEHPEASLHLSPWSWTGIG